VDPRAGLDSLEKRKFLTLPGLELRPARSSLYTDYAIPTRALQGYLKPVREQLYAPGVLPPPK
jgi:hypothetical protein